MISFTAGNSLILFQILNSIVAELEVQTFIKLNILALTMIGFTVLLKKYSPKDK